LIKAWSGNPIKYESTDLSTNNFALSGEIYSYEDIKFDLKNLVNFTEKLLTDHHFNINNNNYYIDFHHSRASKRKLVPSPFGWHIDDQALISYNTVGVYFCIYKDENIFGGDFFWNEKLEDKNKKLINIQTGTTIIMPGNIAHRPENIQHNQGNFRGPGYPAQEIKMISVVFEDFNRK
jgi:hypothetical protein